MPTTVQATATWDNFSPYLEIRTAAGGESVIEMAGILAPDCEDLDLVEDALTARYGTNWSNNGLSIQSTPYPCEPEELRNTLDFTLTIK